MSATGFGDEEDPQIYFIGGLLIQMGLLKSCYRNVGREVWKLDLNLSINEMFISWKRVILEGQDDSAFRITEAILQLSTESLILGLQIINLKSSIPCSLLLHKLRNLCLKDANEERIIGFLALTV